MKKPIVIRYSYHDLKEMAIDTPDALWRLIDKHGWSGVTWVINKDRPKLTLIHDFIKNPEKYKDYWQKRAERGGTQLNLF
jgi:hypothetical protein